MLRKLTKEEILGAVVTNYYDDLDFIEALNNLTYSRKVQLRRLNQLDRDESSN